MDLDETLRVDVATWTNRLTFEPDPIKYKRWYVEFYVGENPITASRGFKIKIVLFTEPSEDRSTECLSSYYYY